MNKGKIIALSLTAGLLYWLYSKYAIARKMDISIVNFSLDGSLLNPTINLGIKIVNNTNFVATISNVRGAIYQETAIVGEFFAGGVYRLDKNFIIIPVQINTTFHQLLSSIQNTLNTKKIDYLIAGNVTIDNIDFPFSQSINT
jgi:hypothetical protein